MSTPKNNSDHSPPTKKGDPSPTADGTEPPRKKIKVHVGIEASPDNIEVEVETRTYEAALDDMQAKLETSEKKVTTLETKLDETQRKSKNDNEKKDHRICKLKQFAFTVGRTSESHLAGEMKALANAVFKLHPQTDRNPDAMTLRKCLYDVQKGLQWYKDSADLAISNDEDQAAIDGECRTSEDVADGVVADGDDLASNN